MNTVLLLLSGVIATFSSVSLRTFQRKVQRSDLHLQVYQICYMLLAALVYLLLAGFRLPAGWQAWALAVGFGLCLTTSTIGTAQSYLCGPMSLSSLIVSCNVVIPILVGCFAYGERLSLWHILGIVLLFVTFVLSAGPTGTKVGKIPLKWYLMVLMAFLASGFGAVIISAYSKLAQGASNHGFLGLCFLMASGMLALWLLISARGKGPQGMAFPPLFFLALLGSAVGVFGCNTLLLYLAAVMPASVLYPVYNGLSSVLICSVSCLVFREPMDGKKLLTLLLGIAAVILLNL